MGAPQTDADVILIALQGGTDFHNRIRVVIVLGVQSERVRPNCGGSRCRWRAPQSVRDLSPLHPVDRHSLFADLGGCGPFAFAFTVAVGLAFFTLGTSMVPWSPPRVPLVAAPVLVSCLRGVWRKLALAVVSTFAV